MHDLACIQRITLEAEIYDKGVINNYTLEFPCRPLVDFPSLIKSQSEIIMQMFGRF